MADITFTCPYCEQKIEAPEEMAGTKAECPSCQCELQIPKDIQSNRASPSPVLISPPPLLASVPASEFAGSRQPNPTPHFVAAKCPSCGGDLQVPDNRDQVKCMYCGGTVVTRQAIQSVSFGVSVANLMELAKAAANAGNPKEAYDYYTRVLECDPRNVNAWLGKGEAVGWMSTIYDIKITEMIAGLNNAIIYAADSDIPALQKHCANVINSVAMACYSLARKNVQEFARLDNVWQDYLNQSSTLISALEVGCAHDPNSTTTLGNIICICADNIQGISFIDFDDMPRAVFVNDQYEAWLRAKIDECSAKMYRLNPGFVKPDVKRTSSHSGWDIIRLLSRLG